MSAAEPKQESKPEPIPFGRPINEIVADLSKPVPQRFIKTKTVSGTEIPFIPWHAATKLLDYYAPGWDYHLRFEHIAGKVVAIAALSIPCKEGIITREASGFEDEDKEKFGDPFSNASSMALRHAAAHFGLGRHLYDKH